MTCAFEIRAVRPSMVRHKGGHMTLPKDFERTTRQQFDKLENREIPFEEFLRLAAEESQRTAQFVGGAKPYKPTIGKITPCGNGSLDNGLDPNEWQGAWGTQISGFTGGVVTFNNLTAGILSGPINSPAAHQTLVPAGFDPNVGIPTTAQGSTGAVRIGNANAGFAFELLSKTFIVTPAQRTITFWYAAVLQNPAGHSPQTQPFFQVRVTDASGAIVPGAFTFGSGSDTLIADKTNPFFQTVTDVGRDPIVYRDWTCAKIDLSSKVGQQVTIEFVTADCGWGGHWGYAYIDNFCGTCACDELEHEQDDFLAKECAKKVNLLPRLDCDHPEHDPEKGDCRCECVGVKFPDIKPCISVAWGDSKCDCMETDDVEVLCVTVCNCYSNVTFRDLSIAQIRITDANGNPVPTLPDGTPSVQIIPSGPICFGDIGPCRRRATCVSRELVIQTRGAVGKDYHLSFEGVCFEVCHEYQTKGCFLVKLCQD
jgi:hypothetical protein